MQPDEQQPDEQRQLAVPGLVNLGNTCFLNATLQALAACASLVQQLGATLQMLHSAGGHASATPPAPLAAALLDTLQALQPQPCSAALRSFAPRSLLRELRSRLPPGVLEAGEEHDAAEAVEHLCSLAAQELAAAFARCAQPQLTARASLAALLADPPAHNASSKAAPCSEPCTGAGGSGTPCTCNGHAPSDSSDAAAGCSSSDAGAGTAAAGAAAAATAAAPTEARQAAGPPLDAVLAGWRRLARLPLQGSTAHELRCLRCGHRSSVQLEPFWVLQLAIPTAPGQTLLGNVAAAPGASLAACMASLFGFEALQGVHCTRCSLAASLEAAEAGAAAQGTAAAAAGTAASAGTAAALAAAAAGEELAHAASHLPPELQRLRQTLACGGRLIEGECYQRLVEAAGLPWRPRPGPFAKGTVAARLPPVLCLQLRRGFWSPAGHYCKVSGHVRFPLLLDLQLGQAIPLLGHERPPAAPQQASLWQARAQAVQPPSQQAEQTEQAQQQAGTAAPAPVPYQLQAVVVHHGSLAGAGHYTVYRRLESGGGGGGGGGGSGGGLGGANGGCWVRASDETVHPAEIAEVLAAEAALLVYEQLPA